MTPEQIRENLKRSCTETILVELTAQLAELNEKFADFFATDPTVYVPKEVKPDSDIHSDYEDYKRRKENWKEYLEQKEK